MSLVQMEHSLDSSLSANFAASAMQLVGTLTSYDMPPTLLDIQIPERPSDFHHGVGDALEIRERYPAHFQGHLRRARRQGTQQRPERWEERKEIARMALAAQFADLKHL